MIHKAFIHFKMTAYYILSCRYIFNIVEFMSRSLRHSTLNVENTEMKKKTSFHCICRSKI